MKEKVFWVILALLFISGIALVAHAGIGSESFFITTSVLSGGGAAISSANFQVISTVSQPTPLMDPDNPPSSESFSLNPGFWYTPDVPPIKPCEGDFDSDGDVDGTDLSVFAADFGRTDCASGSLCEGDFDNDGDVDGTDLSVFASDFGRTDCQ